MRQSWKTTEFWVGVLGVIGALVGQLIGQEFPTVAFAPLGAFIVSRLAEKIKTVNDPIGRAWKTGEFWAAIGTCLLTIVTDVLAGGLTPEVQAGVLAISAFIGLRGPAKTNPVK